jgi:hypothetical protein
MIGRLIFKTAQRGVSHKDADFTIGNSTMVAFQCCHCRGNNAHHSENNMKKLMTICFALALLTLGVASGVASAQYDKQNDNMKNDNMKTDSSKAIQITGKVSDDGKMFVKDKDSKSFTIANPDAVKGHEGHHVTLTAHVDADKNEVHVMSLKMEK